MGANRPQKGDSMREFECTCPGGLVERPPCLGCRANAAIREAVAEERERLVDVVRAEIEAIWACLAAKLKDKSIELMVDAAYESGIGRAYYEGLSDAVDAMSTMFAPVKQPAAAPSS
jgi:hypothetical protein